jgi:hypothetical protein
MLEDLNDEYAMAKARGASELSLLLHPACREPVHCCTRSTRTYTTERVQLTPYVVVRFCGGHTRLRKPCLLVVSCMVCWYYVYYVGFM